MLTDEQFADFQVNGFVVVPGLVAADEVAALRDGAWQQFPSPQAYFADPRAFADLVSGPFAGLANFPWTDATLNRLVAHPKVLAIVRQILGVDDIRLYKGELWAKYGGSVDYDQNHHRDFGNHTLVVPSIERRWMQVTTFTYLCDVDEHNGPTAIVPKHHSAQIPLGRRKAEPGELVEFELPAHGPAGSTLFYSTEIFHRATAIRSPGASRFTVLADYRSADATWTNKHAFGHLGQRPEMIEFVTNAGPEARTLLDVPAPGHPYWTSQTITDMEIRYPGIDMSPYCRAVDA